MSDLKLEEFYNWCDTRIAIAKAATPGPWSDGHYRIEGVDCDFFRLTGPCIEEQQDIKHIAACDPQTQVKLLTALREAVTALEHLAPHLKVSGEPTFTTLAMVSEAESLRRAANLIEKRDSDIINARAALALIKQLVAKGGVG